MHDNRSYGNRVGNTFVYVSLASYEGEKITGAGFYRVDVHPDAASKFGAISFESWEQFEEYEIENHSPALFIIRSDNTESNDYGL